MQVPGYILQHTNIKDAKIWQFYLLLSGWAAIYAVMNISVILFLQEFLGSIFLAGLALSIGSFFSLLFDGIFAYIQKVFQARQLFLASIIGLIFSIILLLIPGSFLLTYLAAILFRISFDLCDITAMSYVLAKSLPAEYGQNLSYKQLAQGIGMITGFILSAILVQTSYFIGGAAEMTQDILQLSQTFDLALFSMKILLLILLIILWGVGYIMFDKNIESFDTKSLMSSFQKLQAETIEELKTSSMEIVKNIPGLIKQEKNQIQLKNTEHTKEQWSFKKIFEEFSGAIKKVYRILKKTPHNISLIWSMGIAGLFSYWDTFLMTFLPIFFTEVLRQQDGWLAGVPGSILMFLFIFPVLGMLPVVAKMGDKYGRFYFMTFGLFLTMVSCFIIGITPYSYFWVIIASGYGISFGYLFAMSSAKAQSASKINEFFAVEEQKSEIDSNTSTGPMMLIDNIGNIIGPVLGGGMIALLQFQGFFLLFALFLAAILIYTLKHFADISGHPYIFQSHANTVMDVIHKNPPINESSID